MKFMERKIRKVAMTGGTGPIGLALIRRLTQEGIDVTLLARKVSVKRAYLPTNNPLLRVINCDLSELCQIEIKENDFDVFFHLGWANTNADQRDDYEQQLINVRYAADAVELAYKLGCKAFVGCGSQAEYGRKNMPLTSDVYCKPDNMYGATKLSACHVTRLLCEQYGMEQIWPRVLSGYGYYDNVHGVLTSNIIAYLQGKTLHFSRGEQIWDFVFHEDIANALYLIAKNGKHGKTYPIGSGKARPLREYCEILCRHLGKDVDVVFGDIPYKKNGIMHLEANIEELKKDTGWKPLWSFEEGIDLTIEFYKDWIEKWSIMLQKL